MGDLSARGKVSETQNSLKLLMHKHIKIWWNKAFLEKYLQRSLIPRGLRIQVFPLFPIDENFTSKWEEGYTNGSLKFMELSIGHNNRTLDMLDTEIESLQKQLKETYTEDEKDKCNQLMEKNIYRLGKGDTGGKNKKIIQGFERQPKRV